MLLSLLLLLVWLLKLELGLALLILAVLVLALALGKAPEEEEGRGRLCPWRLPAPPEPPAPLPPSLLLMPSEAPSRAMTERSPTCGTNSQHKRTIKGTPGAWFNSCTRLGSQAASQVQHARQAPLGPIPIIHATEPPVQPLVPHPFWPLFIQLPASNPTLCSLLDRRSMRSRGPAAASSRPIPPSVTRSLYPLMLSSCEERVKKEGALFLALCSWRFHAQSQSQRKGKLISRQTSCQS